ncbi:hypothetical protein [Muricauda sp. MAR_2010_75]|uniref:hypothetical protein n=1 Tax=Allomuricauda sp. MAR_2010_75 TaxID=1250232 RepID=UPI000569284F|nr:hypothetical protein [Muricauda sp. MAR_2010_75]
MILDHEKLHRDMLIKLRKEGKTQIQGAKEMGLASSIFQRVWSYKDLKLNTYLALVSWLKKDVSFYLIKQ